MTINRRIKSVFSYTVATLVLGGVFSLPAAAANLAAQAEIPFAFTIQDVTLPAGTYRVEIREAAGVLYLSTAKSGKLMFLTHPSGDQSNGGEAKLVFLKSGSQTALTEAFFSGGTRGFGLPTTLVEGQKTEVALVSPVTFTK